MIYILNSLILCFVFIILKIKRHSFRKYFNHKIENILLTATDSISMKNVFIKGIIDSNPFQYYSRNKTYHKLMINLNHSIQQKFLSYQIVIFYIIGSGYSLYVINCVKLLLVCHLVNLHS